MVRLRIKESVPSFLAVKKWTAEFKRDRTSNRDNERTGCPKSVVTDEIVTNPQYRIRRLSTQGSKNCRGYNQLDSQRPPHFTWSSMYAEVECSMGTVFDYNRLKTHLFEVQVQLWAFLKSVLTYLNVIPPSFFDVSSP